MVNRKRNFLVKRWQWGKQLAGIKRHIQNCQRWEKASVCVSQYACCAVLRRVQIKRSAMQWNYAVCTCRKHLGNNKLMPFYSCTAEMGGGERGKKRGQGVGKKKYGFRYPKNIRVGIVRWDIFSGSGLWHWLFYIMLLQDIFALAQSPTSVGKMYYNATLCNLASTDLHTGINGTVVVVGVQCLFALFFGCWDSSLPPQERGWQCAVARWQKQRKKYDSCKSVAMPQKTGEALGLCGWRLA